MRPATARRERTPQSSRPITAQQQRPKTSHGLSSDGRAQVPERVVAAPPGSSKNTTVEPLGLGLGWDYYVQNEEVAKLKSRIAQLELKVLTEKKKVVGVKGDGRKVAVGRAAATMPEEEELLEALQWARSEEEVFMGIDMAMYPGDKAFVSVMKRMLTNAGAVGMSEAKISILAKTMFVKYANPFTRRLDLQKVRALVTQQHQQRGKKRVEDWVRGDTGFAGHVLEAVDKGRSGDPLCIAAASDVIASLDHVQVLW